MKRPLRKLVYAYDAKEIASLTNLAMTVFEKFGDANSSAFLKNYKNFLVPYSPRLKKHLVLFMQGEYDIIIIEKIPIDSYKLEKTPPHWNSVKDSYTLLLQFYHFFIATLAGHPYGWRTHQNGSIISDVLPIKGFEYYQQGFGSSTELTFHTEDSFHKARPDFFTLMCLRNSTLTGTTFFPTDLSKLPVAIKRELFKKQFDIRPDLSHSYSIHETLSNTNKEINLLESGLEMRKISILSGSYANPSIHLDPENIITENLTDFAKFCYQYACEEIKKTRTEVVLEPGQICFVNNSKIPHGRNPFKANYDGKDRWFERILILKDIKKFEKLSELSWAEK